MALTPKQKKFADLYIKLGNATEAARQAGYSEKYLHKNAPKLRQNKAIAAYITQMMEGQDAERVASANEVLEFYTAVMRGEKKDQFGLESSLADRLKAADSLMKRWSAVEGKKGADRPLEDDPLSASLREMAKELENGRTE